MMVFSASLAGSLTASKRSISVATSAGLAVDAADIHRLDDVAVAGRWSPCRAGWPLV
jgi:hypothetical protein